MIQDEFYINRTFQLALNGTGTTAPNPLVGAVIVYKDYILGEGWHRKAGEPHAEVVAVRSVKDKSLLRKSTLYVNLEPCSFHGRTPACSTMIIREKIPRVVISTRDPNPLVSGQGIHMLRQAGIEVITGISETAANELNRIFFTAQTRRRPYVILKWAQSADGFIAGPDGKTVILTGIRARQTVHKWRSEFQSILIGKNTLKNDNPLLDTRLWNKRNPVPVILGGKGIRTGNKTEKIHSLIHLFVRNVKNYPPPYKTYESGSVNDILNTLHRLGITSVFVEGGRNILEQFIDAGLWDEARVFTAPVILGKGIAAPRLSGEKWIKTRMLEKDKLDYYAHSSNPYIHDGRFL
jgi:diaminohydroxyphosphoribosylaminopyrimidine deaminase/5-amino-6-(5-phosphoribosylamino)uracil reductase